VKSLGQCSNVTQAGTAFSAVGTIGWNPIGEWSADLQSASLTKTYTWGMDLSGSMQGAGGVGGLLAVTDSTNTFFPTYDGNGNVSEYLNSTGAIAAHYEYDPFGRETVSNGPNANDFAHRFSTKPLDTASGLLYYGYRYLDPATGRWPSRDPIEEQGGINIYSFVKNRAVNEIDWLGYVTLKTDKVTLDEKKTNVIWSDKYDGVNKWETQEKNLGILWGNTDKYGYVSCKCLAEGTDECRIECDVAASATIYLNKNRVKEFKKEVWTRVYGHEQRHVKSFKWHVDNKVIPGLKKESDDPCGTKRADDLTLKYTKILRAHFVGFDHVGDGNSTPESPIVGQPYDPIENSVGVPDPPQGW